MKQIKEISNIDWIVGFYKDYIVAVDYNKAKELLFISQENFELQHKLPYANNTIEIVNNNLYLFSNDIFIYDNKKQEFDLCWKSTNNSSAGFFSNSIIETNYNRDTKNVQLTMYDIKSKTKLWEKEYQKERGFFNKGNNLYITDLMLTNILFVDVDTGCIINRIDFEKEMTESTTQILLYKNTLLIPLNNNHLLCIDAQTGKKLWELKDCFNYYNLDNKTGLLYGYGGEKFEIIDAKKGKKILQKQFEGSMEKYEIFVSQHMNTLYEDGLYFTSNQKQIKFGKVNICTHEIEFVQELVEDKERIGRANASKPVCHNGRLYILDSVGTLHIYEDE